MEFIKAFEEIDTDESGEITRFELEEYMRAKNYKPAFVEKWLRIFDVDHSGTITLEEFCNTLGLIPGKKQKERIERRKSLKQFELERKNKENDEKDENENGKSDQSKDKVDNAANVSGTQGVKGVDRVENLYDGDKNKSIVNNRPNDSIKDKEMDKENNHLQLDEIISLSTSVEAIEVTEDDKDGKGKISMQSSFDEKHGDKMILQVKNDKTDDDSDDSRTHGSSKINIKYTIKTSKDIVYNDVQIIAEDPDISDKLRVYVLKLSLDCARMFDDELEMAKYVKQKMDLNHKRNWHVVTGRDAYGCLVTHEKGKFIHVRAKDWGILMWQVQESCK